MATKLKSTAGASATPSGRYSFQQLEAIWIQAGGNPRLAPTMAAIALAESGGNPQAHNFNPSTGDDSYGLWQINYYGANRTVRTARWGPPEGMYNPVNNAHAAISLAGDSNSGLHNWSTYNNGAFLKYYNGGSGPSTSQAGLFGGGKFLTALWNQVKSPIGLGSVGNGSITPQGIGVAGGLGVPGLSGLDSTLKKLVFGLVIGGGALLTLLSVLLIGADIGLEQLNGPKPIRKTRSKIAGLPAARVAKRRQAVSEQRRSESEARREAREQERHTADVKLKQARATELRTRTRHRRKNKQEQEKEVKRAYIHGARDATS